MARISRTDISLFVSPSYPENGQNSAVFCFAFCENILAAKVTNCHIEMDGYVYPSRK